jgi:RNA 3'-terminal phosphate cyclase
VALRGDGCFATSRLSLHATTNMEIIEKFLEVSFAIKDLDCGQLVTILPMK